MAGWRDCKWCAETAVSGGVVASGRAAVKRRAPAINSSALSTLKMGMAAVTAGQDGKVEGVEQEAGLGGEHFTFTSL